jgi:hypothetical protein
MEERMGIKLLRKATRQIVEVPSEEAAARLIATGAYERINAQNTVQTQANQIKENPGKKHGPVWQKRINVSKDRNLEICVWPARDQYGAAVTLRESRRDGEKWAAKKIYLPTGSRLLLLGEYIRHAWEVVEPLKKERGVEE